VSTGRAALLLALCLVLPAPGAAADEDPPRPSADAGPPAQDGLTLADCLARALSGSGQLAEARGKVGEWEAKVSEAHAVYYPKLSGLAFGAPTFGVRGNQLTANADRDFGNWGPYLRFEGLLAQPLSTFGRAEAAERAAHERLEVERGSFELVRQRVALDVRRYWLLHLYARSLQPTLDSVKKTLDGARQKAQELYDSNSGKVTNVDLMKLEYAATELEKYRVQAETGAALALAALQHTMGLPADPPLALADAALPPVDEEEPPPLEALVKLALERRPEAAQLRHGKQAAESLARMESKADLPVMALVGQLAASWSPNRDDAKNPYAYDPYNELSGGVALAFQFDVDLARSHARSEGAKSLGAQVDGLARYAATGIPVEVRKARDEALQARRLATLSQQGSSAARKWMVFAGSAYAAGTGETKDLLEGLAAYAQARKGYFDAVLAYHVARAQLDVATGAPPGPAAR
jgi:outer membrane protein TolC